MDHGRLDAAVERRAALFDLLLRALGCDQLLALRSPRLLAADGRVGARLGNALQNQVKHAVEFVHLRMRKLQNYQQTFWGALGFACRFDPQKEFYMSL